MAGSVLAAGSLNPGRTRAQGNATNSDCDTTIRLILTPLGMGTGSGLLLQASPSSPYWLGRVLALVGPAALVVAHSLDHLDRDHVQRVLEHRDVWVLQCAGGGGRSRDSGRRDVARRDRQLRAPLDLRVLGLAGHASGAGALDGHGRARERTPASPPPARTRGRGGRSRASTHRRHPIRTVSRPAGTRPVRSAWASRATGTARHGRPGGAGAAVPGSTFGRTVG